jgi:hypothetical protein
MKSLSKNLIKEATQNALNRIELVKSKLAALHYACKDLRADNYHEEIIKEDFSKIHSALYQQLNEAYGNLFMFCAVSGDKKMMIKAKKMALDHYLSEDKYIMGYLGFDSRSSWDGNLEKQFREEIKHLEN